MERLDQGMAVQADARLVAGPAGQVDAAGEVVGLGRLGEQRHRPEDVRLPEGRGLTDRLLRHGAAQGAVRRRLHAEPLQLHGGPGQRHPERPRFLAGHLHRDRPGLEADVVDAEVPGPLGHLEPEPTVGVGRGRPVGADDGDPGVAHRTAVAAEDQPLDGGRLPLLGVQGGAADESQDRSGAGHDERAPQRRDPGHRRRSGRLRLAVRPDRHPLPTPRRPRSARPRSRRHSIRGRPLAT